jgi:cytochrome c peroxidase
MKPLLLLVFAFLAPLLEGQQLRSLKQVRIPEPPELGNYVRDREALITLGKAFFWDMQVGSDGRTACATCHFHAGADHRAQNQLFDSTNTFPVNRQLEMYYFPFRWLADPGNRNSQAIRDLSMRVGSAGVFRRIFKDLVPGSASELGEDVLDKPEFISGGLHVRRVTARNAPTVINSVFNIRNFWDGRASRIFNGFTPSGRADVPGILFSRSGVLERRQVRLNNASLSSQAVGPALDPIEMSYEGRTWPKLGKKILSLAPLAFQHVASTDSVLGRLANAAGPGLQDGITYLGLIQTAFHPGYWDSAQLVDASGNALAGRAGTPATTAEFTQAEYNFSLFWGLALQAYQTTLVSDDSPFDRFMDGEETALTDLEREGMQFYQTTGRCTNCHGGAEMTAASFSAANFGNENIRAFQRTGVRPAFEDTGTGNGSFKSSGLRNIEFSGPYFHNGGAGNLEHVVEFYMRAGDFPPINGLRAFGATSRQKAALVAFLISLTDDRVRFERAPFDHPELCVPAGHVESSEGVLARGDSTRFPFSAAEKWVAIPAVGAAGNRAPLQNFQELLEGIGKDGSRAHTLTEACTAPLP